MHAPTTPAAEFGSLGGLAVFPAACCWLQTLMKAIRAMLALNLHKIKAAVIAWFDLIISLKGGKEVVSRGLGHTRSGLPGQVSETIFLNEIRLTLK